MYFMLFMVYPHITDFRGFLSRFSVGKIRLICAILKNFQPFYRPVVRKSTKSKETGENTHKKVENNAGIAKLWAIFALILCG